MKKFLIIASLFVATLVVATSCGTNCPIPDSGQEQGQGQGQGQGEDPGQGQGQGGQEAPKSDLINKTNVTIKQGELLYFGTDVADSVVTVTLPEGVTDFELSMPASEKVLLWAKTKHAVALRPGTADITVKAGDKTAICRVTVEANALGDGLFLGEKYNDLFLPAQPFLMAGDVDHIVEQMHTKWWKLDTKYDKPGVLHFTTTAETCRGRTDAFVHRRILSLRSRGSQCSSIRSGSLHAPVCRDI